jgi:histidyl-tRNA synthetase
MAELRYRAPKGTNDLVYPESERTERVLELAGEILTLHGYRRISTPIFENTELFKRSIGEDTDIVTKEMYTFDDHGGESLTLRPEGTAPVIRAYLERGLFSQGLPQKLFYFGPMFRRERPQAGRFRQFNQIGAEAIGSSDPLIDAEIISISAALFQRLGLERYSLALNSVGCRRCRPGYREVLTEYLEEIAPSLCEQCRKRAKANPMRVFDCKEETCRESLSDAPAIADHICPECRDHFAEVVAGLELLKVPFEVDLRLVRGLDYYTKTAFEFQFEGLGAQNAVSAGGRYDYLAEELGGPPTPGVGFSMGVERLMISLDAEGRGIFEELNQPSVFIAGVEGVDRSRLFSILKEIREAGIRADGDFLGRSLKAQMKQADRLGAKLALIIGGEELERGEVALRDLGRSEQWNVPVGDTVSEVKKFLEGA